MKCSFLFPFFCKIRGKLSFSTHQSYSVLMTVWALGGSSLKEASMSHQTKKTMLQCLRSESPQPSISFWNWTRIVLSLRLHSGLESVPLAIFWSFFLSLRIVTVHLKELKCFLKCSPKINVLGKQSMLFLLMYYFTFLNKQLWIYRRIYRYCYYCYYYFN